jgi:ABC-type transporter Mla subunit MlaD
MPENETTPETSSRRGWDFSPGSLLQIAQLVAILSGLIYWLVTNTQRYANTEQHLTELQAQVSGQVSDLRAQLSTASADLRAQLATLPDQRARMELYEKRFSDADKMFAALDGRLNSLERVVIELRADYNAMARAPRPP